MGSTLSVTVSEKSPASVYATACTTMGTPSGGYGMDRLFTSPASHVKVRPR